MIVENYRVFRHMVAGKEIVNLANNNEKISKFRQIIENFGKRSEISSREFLANDRKSE